jgi:hypothetical protein
MNSLDRLINKFAENILNPTIILMFAAALVIFLWGVLKYIKGADNDVARKEGAQHILWGLIGMSVMIAAFTLIKIVLNTFNIDIPETIK